MPFSPAPDGTELEVWVQPRASRDQIVGLQGTALKIRIAAPPVEGEANQALVRFLAKELGVARGAITLLRGLNGRHKRVHVRGLTPDEVRQGLGLG